MRSDIVPGGVFPDYELPDQTNIMRKLSELQGDDPLILTLARGHYCPKEHLVRAPTRIRSIRDAGERTRLTTRAFSRRPASASG